MTPAKLRRAFVTSAAGVVLAAVYTTLLAQPARTPGASATAPAPAVQTDRAGGVTVKVTPRTVAREAALWEFAVVLDTHSQDLSQDMARSAALVDAKGKRYAPLSWEGAGPGGHHREGVLKFKPLPPEADAVVLEMTGIGGSSVRTFRWQLR